MRHTPRLLVWTALLATAGALEVENLRINVVEGSGASANASTASGRLGAIHFDHTPHSDSLLACTAVDATAGQDIRFRMGDCVPAGGNVVACGGVAASSPATALRQLTALASRPQSQATALVLDSRASTGLASCEWTAPHDGDATVTHDAASATGRGRAMHVASPEGAGLVWALRRVAKGMPPDSGATPDDGGIGEDPVASMLEVGNMGGLGLARPPAGVSESEAAHHSASLEHSAMMGPVSLLQVSGDSHGAVEAGGDPPVDAHHYLSGHVAWDAAHPSHAGHTDRGGVARAAQHVVDQAGDSMRHLHPVEAAHVARHVHTSLGGLADTAGLTEHHSSRAHAVGTDHVESLARGLVSANVTADAAGGHPAPVGTEAVCPTAATPFPTYFPGRTAWLRHELNGAGAFVLGSLQHVAGPATGAAKIQVYGREGGLDYDRIWIADALKPWRFQVGEVVLLRGFREPGNTGLFEVVARPYRNTLQLGEMLPTTVREGRTAWLTPEVSGGAGGGGGALYGCYGEVVGPAAPSRPMAVHRRGVVCADVALHPERLEAGELVRMRGFAQAGNAGTFRLANSSLVHAPSSRERGSMLCLQLEDARPCEGGRIPWLRREENGRGAVVAGSRGRETLPSHRGAVVRVSGLESGLERGGAGREARAGFTELARWPLTEEGLPARNATRYDGPDALWVDPALGGASLFAEDEVVLLHGFEAPGNMGRFRVARLVGNTTLVLREVDPRDEVCPQVHRPSIEDLIPPITDVTHAIDTAEHERLRVRHLPRSPPHPRPPPPPRPCPKNCSYDQGVCVDGECRCEPTWRGVACDTPQIPCPFNCSGQGTCDETTGRCVCDATWGGAACDHRALPCPMDCSGHGTCSALTGKCTCEGTWSGVGCHLRVLPCPHNCTDSQGRCDYTRGKCVCEPTWRGVACATPQIACPLNCSGHGTCAPDSGRCDCELTWHGIACNKRVSTCPADCVDSAHGECDEDTGQCVCRRAWTGIDCSRPHCGEHGTMRLDGSCECDPGWYAPVQDAVCELAPEECPCTRRCVADMSQQDTCSGHAYGCSVEGKCLCRHHWAGGKCEIPLIRTGEINQRNHPDAITQSRFPDRGMLLCRAAFAIYAMCRDPEALQGMVNRDDIMCVLHLNGVPVDSPAEQEKMVRVALLSHDKNGDGLLAFNEFITACAATSDPLVNRAVKWAFTDIDLEHDGVITEDEVVRKLKIRDERKRPNVMLPQPIRSVPADQDSGGLADMGRSYAEARRESAQSGAASSAGGSGSGSGPGGSANTAQSGKNATAGGHGSAAASAGPGEEAARDSLERMKREVHVPQEDQSGAWPHEGATTPPKRAGGLHQLQEGELRYRVGEAGMREEGVGSGSGLWGGKASPQGDATKDDRESASDGVGEGQSSPRHEQGGRPHARQGGTAEGHDGKHPQSSDTSNAGGAGAGGTSSGQGQESSGASSAAGGAGGESESPIRDNDYELHVDRTSKGGRQAGEGVGSPEMFARGIPPSVGEENKTEVVGDSTLSEGDATPLPEGAEMPGTGMEDREDEAEKWMDRCDKNFDAMCDEEEFPDMVAGDCPECLCLACSKGVQPSSDDKDGVKWCAVFPDAPGMRGPCGKGGRPPHGGGDENGGVGDPQALSDFEGDGGSDGSGSAGGSGRGDDDGGGDEDDKDKGGDDGGGGGGGPPGSSSTSTTTSSTSSGGGPDGSGAPPGDFPTQPGEPSPTNIPIPNPYSWCDMDNPFGNPFCPTPNPQFNILIKMMIPGIIRPAIDQWQAKLMKGLGFVIELVDCMVPKADESGSRRGPPGFLQTGESESGSGSCGGGQRSPSHAALAAEAKRHALSLLQVDEEGQGRGSEKEGVGVKEGLRAALEATDRVFGRGLASLASRGRSSGAAAGAASGQGGGGEDEGEGASVTVHQGKLVPSLKKSLYEKQVHPMGASITNLVNFRLSKPLQSRLHGQLMTSLRDTLNSSISHGILHATGNALPLILSKTVPQMIDKLVPSFVFHSLTQSLTGTLTRSLVHSLSPALVSTMSMSPQEQYWCYHCHHRREHCEKCHRHASSEVHLSLYYANFYADYYSDYYADYFTKNAFGLLKN